VSPFSRLLWAVVFPEYPVIMNRSSAGKIERMDVPDDDVRRSSHDSYAMIFVGLLGISRPFFYAAVLMFVRRSESP
jgi:hypothetical protein